MTRYWSRFDRWLRLLNAIRRFLNKEPNDSIEYFRERSRLRDRIERELRFH